MRDEKNKKSGGGMRFKSPEDLRAFAQAYYSMDFPNPEREGCPGPGVIKTLVQSETLPDDEMRQHLFSCSDCFLEYREAMTAYKKAPIQHLTPWWKSSPFPKLKLSWAHAAAAFLICITALGIVFYILNRDSQLSTVAQNSSDKTTGTVNANLDQPASMSLAASPNATAVGSPSSLQPKSQPRKASRNYQDLIATVSIRIDLREDVMRSFEEMENRKEKVIELAASRANLLFNLPEHSTKGIYEVKIVDPFGKLLKSAKGISRDGKTLKVFLDLRGLDEARCRLCVSRESEAPDCYQIVINRTIKQ